MRCIGCGCTENRACVGGCSWLCVNPPKCSACVESGVLSLLHDNIGRIASWLPRRDEGLLIITGTGRRMRCEG
jgi:hypothetical protein